MAVETWLIFKSEIPLIKHHLENDERVIDKACLISHEHEHAPIEVRVRTYEGEFLDFKVIKAATEKIIAIYFNGDLGIKSAETMTAEIWHLLTETLHRLPSDIEVQIMETAKYGVLVRVKQ